MEDVPHYRQTPLTLSVDPDKRRDIGFCLISFNIVRKGFFSSITFLLNLSGNNTEIVMKEIRCIQVLGCMSAI